MGLIKSFSGSRGGFSKKPLAAGGKKGGTEGKVVVGGLGGKGCLNPPGFPPWGDVRGGEIIPLSNVKCQILNKQVKEPYNANLALKISRSFWLRKLSI